MNNADWHISLFAPMVWRKTFKVWCAGHGYTFTDLVMEALRDIAKKKGIRLPS